MNWMHDAARIYDKVMSGEIAEGERPLVPICHTEANAHIEVVLDGQGNFLDARMVPKNGAVTILPCTEESATKAGTKPKPHPLCDKLQYLAPDFRDAGGEVTVGFQGDAEQPHKNFMEVLMAWCNSPYAHPKAKAVCAYLLKGALLSDLKTKLKGIAFGSSGNFLEAFPDKKNYATGDPMDSTVRWIVEAPGDANSKLWKDKSLQASWCAYYAAQKEGKGVCYVSARDDLPLALFHPARLRHGGDKAKLISANDKDGFTYRGRFNCQTEACGVGFELSQKAHNALRWLIARQGRRFGECAFVTWGWSEDFSSPAPQPFDDTDTMLQILSETRPSDGNTSSLQRDAEEARTRNVTLAAIYAENLTSCMAGYAKKLGDKHRNVHLVAIDAASTGCMSLVLDREIESSRLLGNLENWHRAAAWIQDFGFDGTDRKKIRRQFIGAPSPEAIAWLACGRNPSEKHLSAVVNRILPVIIDGMALPEDIAKTCLSRVIHRTSVADQEWEKALGIACSLYRYTKKERNYQMELEYDRKSRDYLWGCLLALAEVTERYSLDRQSMERRPTNAERHFVRFAEQPFTTWGNIESALQPYLARLAAGGDLARGISARFKCLTDRIMRDGFEKNGLLFTDNSRLTGEFLLGYHCQRRELYRPRKSDNDQDKATEEQDNE